MTVREALNDIFAEMGMVLPADNDVLYTLGIDSLELVQMCLSLDEKLHVQIDVKKLDKVKTMADLTNLVKAYVRYRGHTCSSPTTICTCGFSEVFWEDPVMKIADGILS